MKLTHFLFLLLSFSGFLLQGSSAQEWREEILGEGKFTLRWIYKPNEETIEFEAKGSTSGYVGFGFSRNGGMEAADIFLAGIKDGAPYHDSYHGRVQPNHITRDIDSPDWKFLGATEDRGITTIKFMRVLNTCDDQDIVVNPGTIKIIWALGSDDNIAQHAHRGTQSLNLLDAKTPEIDFSKLENFTFITEEVMLKQDTIYWCSIHKAPLFDGRVHVVAFEPIVKTQASIKHSHHFTIFKCTAPENETDPDAYFQKYIDLGGGECYLPPEEEKVPYSQCSTYFYDWSIGGRTLVFPDYVGLPLGETDKNEYYMYEIHWDNPDELEISVETGVRMYYTNETREYDAELLVIDHKIQPSLIIPPSSVNHITAGHCSPTCTQQNLEQDVKIFNLMLHAHTSAKKIKVRQFRGNEELEWLAYDEFYDFNYQENRPLLQERILKPGDQLTIECTYDTTWNKDKTTVIAGYSTREEMCESYIYYYPRQNLRTCLSFYPNDKVYERFGIGRVRQKYGQIDPIVVTPESLEGQTLTEVVTKAKNWTDEDRKELENELRFGIINKHYDSCGRYSRRIDTAEYEMTIGYPDVKEYVPPNICKKPSESSAFTIHLSIVLFLFMGFFRLL